MGMAMFQTLMAVFMIIGPLLGTFVYQRFGIYFAIGVMGVPTNLTVTLSFQFLSGLFFPCIHTGINTLILQASKEEFVGRVNGVLNPLFMGAMVITMSLAGWLKIQVSLVAMYGVSAVLFFIGMLLIMPIFSFNSARTQQSQPLG